jgi:hypothetical protein
VHCSISNAAPFCGQKQSRSILMSRSHSKAGSNYFSQFIAVFGAATAAAAAAESGRQPRARDLRTLGVDPDAFAKIRLR